MPDDRFIHPRLGHGEKVFQLTDLEFRVWMQYLLSSDDCGVMRKSAITIQGDNERLASLPAKKLEAALTKLVTIGLLTTFSHQGRAYLCQLDWQEWQKVRWPRASVNPQPDTETLATCTAATRALFATQAKHHRSGLGVVSEPSPSAHGEPAETPPSLARVEHRLTATANGNGKHPEGESEGKPTPLLRNHRNCMGLCSERICLLARQFEDFVGRLGGDRETAELKVKRWAEDVLLAWNDGVKRTIVIQGDTFKWWNARYEEWQGSPKAVQKRPDGVTGGSSCGHMPMCRTVSDCIEKTIADGRAQKAAQV